MNENVLKEKLEQVQDETKVWLGKTLHNKMEDFESILDKATDKLLEQKGDALKQYETAKEIFESRTEEVHDKIQSQWDKFSSQDVKEIGESFEKFTTKLKEKYNYSQEDVNTQVREFMNKLKK